MHKVEDYYVLYDNDVCRVICSGWHFTHTCVFCYHISSSCCIVCPLFYGFCLPLWCLQTCLSTNQI